MVINEEHSMTISGSKLCSAVHFTVSSGLIWDWRVLGRDQNFNHKSIKNIDAEGPKCLVFTSAIYQSLQNAIEESKLMYIQKHVFKLNCLVWDIFDCFKKCLVFNPSKFAECDANKRINLSSVTWSSSVRYFLLAKQNFQIIL